MFLLRRPRAFQHLLRTLPRARYATFFSPNDRDPRKVEEVVKAWARDRRPFTDPSSSYPKVEITESNIEKLIYDHTFEPFPVWSDICAHNLNQAPVVGSFIEFKENDRCDFGVVLRQPPFRFNEFHNKLMCLNMHNELVRVYTQDITFCGQQVMDLEWVENLQILPNRFDLAFPARLDLVKILHRFVQSVDSLRPEAASHLSKTYSRIFETSRVVGTSFELVMSECQDVFPSYFQQIAYLHALHLQMSSDPSRWILPNLVNDMTPTNLVAARCTNEVPKKPLYLAASGLIADDVDELLDYSDEKLMQMDSELTSLMQHPLGDHELHLLYSAASTRKFRAGFEGMKLAIVYPHPKLISKLSKLPILKGQASPSLLRGLLTSINYFSASRPPNVALSTNLVGRCDKAASLLSEILPTELARVSLAEESVCIDKFSHLRLKRVYYSDLCAYHLPGQQLAFSYEVVNARKSLINIHMPDVAARVHPGSRTFESIAKSGIWSSVRHAAENQESGIISKDALDRILWPREPSDVSYFRVGDKSHAPSHSCLTVTLEYRHSEADPFLKIGEHVSVSLDNIPSSRFRRLEWAELEQTLTGKLEPSILNSFRLFSREEQKLDHLTGIDHRNINVVYNLLKRHLLVRNRRCGASLDPDIMEPKITLTEPPLQQQFRQPLMLESETDLKYSNAQFLSHELEMLLSACVGGYCAEKNVGILSWSQQLAEEKAPEEVFVSHHNSFLPNFHGSSYEQTLLAKDNRGYVSLAAYLIGNNFLRPQQLSTSRRENAGDGLPRGRIHLANAASLVEGYLNQLQLIAHIHASGSRGMPMFTHVKMSSALKRLGYPAHGEYSSDILQQYARSIGDSTACLTYLECELQTWWNLLAVEKNIVTGPFSCYVTRMGPELPESLRLAWVFCEELAMEVWMAVPVEWSLQIGAAVTADRILHVDAAAGYLVLGARDA